MVWIKKIISIFLCVSMMLTLIACSAEKNGSFYNDYILSYLNYRYTEEFEIIDSVLKYEKGIGDFVEADCKSDKYPETFKAYAYIGKETTFSDTYGNIILNHQYAALVKRTMTYDDTVHIYALLNFGDYELTGDDVNKGIDAIIDERNIDFESTLYIIYENRYYNKKDEVSSIIENRIMGYPIKQQKIFLCYLKDGSNILDFDTLYNDNYSNFEEILMNNNNIIYINTLERKPLESSIDRRVPKG